MDAHVPRRRSAGVLYMGSFYLMWLPLLAVMIAEQFSGVTFANLLVIAIFSPCQGLLYFLACVNQWRGYGKLRGGRTSGGGGTRSLTQETTRFAPSRFLPGRWRRRGEDLNGSSILPGGSMMVGRTTATELTTSSASAAEGAAAMGARDDFVENDLLGGGGRASHQGPAEWRRVDDGNAEDNNDEHSILSLDAHTSPANWGSEEEDEDAWLDKIDEAMSSAGDSVYGSGADKCGGEEENRAPLQGR